MYYSVYVLKQLDSYGVVLQFGSWSFIWCVGFTQVYIFTYWLYLVYAYSYKLKLNFVKL